MSKSSLIYVLKSLSVTDHRRTSWTRYTTLESYNASQNSSSITISWLINAFHFPLDDSSPIDTRPTRSRSETRNLVQNLVKSMAFLPMESLVILVMAVSNALYSNEKGWITFHGFVFSQKLPEIRLLIEEASLHRLIHGVVKTGDTHFWLYWT